MQEMPGYPELFVQPSSASSERVFSPLNASFDEQR